MSHDIKELSKTELEQWCVENGHKPFRARQILKWVYQRGADTFAEMSDISVSLRETLALVFSIGHLSCIRTSVASDGTQKYLFALTDMRNIESVCIPAVERQTLCVSSQVGCAMGCQFCATAHMRNVRNLTAG
jgi:23S rRNA (adenine2503-C2)-methyltransferase